MHGLRAAIECARYRSAFKLFLRHLPTLRPEADGIQCGPSHTSAAPSPRGSLAASTVAAFLFHHDGLHIAVVAPVLFERMPLGRQCGPQNLTESVLFILQFVGQILVMEPFRTNPRCRGAHRAQTQVRQSEPLR